MSMKPSNISISRILMISYGIVIALFALSIAVALYGVHANASMTKEFYNRPYMVSKSAVALRFTIEEMSTYVEQLLNAENDAAKQKALVAIEDLTEQRMNELNVVRSLFKADPDLLERFSNACDELGARRNAVIGAAEAGDIDRAIDLYSNEYLAQKEVTVNLSTEVVNTAEHVAQAFVKDSFSVEVGTSLAIGLLGTAAIVLVIVMWRRITHSIAAPIQEIDRIAKRLADGDLTVRSSCTSGNELGSLASSMNETVASLRFATEQLSETAEQVARSSSQMSDSSQAVAQGSAEQATAIEELAANVQSITHVVGENTESVLTVNSNTSDVLGAVEESSDSIARTVRAIEEIKDNAQSISQLANSIEDISFQTNILALNASVEAARAGDAGRGFAIVAEEIRRLASQVSEASRAADELAGRAIENVEAGSELIGSASSNMEEAVTSIEDIKTAMSSIAHASEQQLEAVAQIQESMDSLSQVVQENSAASEESAVIGEELADRANELKHLIGRFKIDEIRTKAKLGHDVIPNRNRQRAERIGRHPRRPERLRADNAALKQQLDVMRALAFRDQLTGLFSRHYLTDYLEQEIERMSGEANIVLALCDIDDFKLINDVRGHQAGDIAIVCIADILDDLSGNHPVIRWGGEELLLVLFSTPDHEALRLCNQMREEVASYPISDDLGDFSCTLTFGLSAYDPELTFGENFASADRALYHGKETGKNRCVFAQSNQIERDGGNRS